MTGIRRLWLVRHGETTGESSVRFHGSSDVELSPLGRRQVRALVPLLRDVRPAAVVHSPLARARESAAILAEGCAWAASLLVAEERLREISFGHCEGMTAEEIERAFPDFWAAHRQGRSEAFPGGESRAAFALRVAAAFQAVTEQQGDVVVVAHRGTVRWGLRWLLGTGEEGDGFGVDLGSVTVVEELPPWVLARLNVRPGGGE